MYIKNYNQEGDIASSPQIADHILDLMAKDIIKPLGEAGLLDEGKQKTLLTIRDVVVTLSQKAYAYETIYQSKNASHIRN